nr:putative fatty acyl-CoA reductase CG8306 [Leptinotarsa decemlineata]
MSSENGLRSFYSGKSIFITGGSGFVGLCLLEKILRTIPDHGDIYILMRPKRGKEIAERLEEIKKNQVFETILKDKTVDEIFSKVKAIAGDVSQDKLGISPADQHILTENVNVIFHSAATLDFGDTLKTTVDINLLGTRRVIDLAKECRNLAAFVHVSSAYVNAWRKEADEV